MLLNQSMSSLLPTHTRGVLLLPRSFTGLWIFVWLNAFIHTVMYTYYAIAAAGIPYPAKPLITAMQITQFLGGFSLVWRYKNLPCFAADQGMMLSWVFNYLYVGGVLALFLRFFVSEYLKPKKPKSKKQ